MEFSLQNKTFFLDSWIFFFTRTLFFATALIAAGEGQQYAPVPSLDVTSSPYADNLPFPWDDLELWIDNATDEFLDTLSTDELVSRSFNPIPILIILNDIGIMNILQHPFFLRTNTLQKRNVLDQPIFDPFVTAQNQRTVWTNLFVRKKNRSNLTQKHEELKYYLALQEESLLSALENTAQQ